MNLLIFVIIIVLILMMKDVVVLIVRRVLMTLGRIHIVDAIAGPIYSIEQDYETEEKLVMYLFGLIASGMEEGASENINTWVHEFTEHQISLTVRKMWYRSIDKHMEIFGRETSPAHIITSLVTKSGSILPDGRIRENTPDGYWNLLKQYSTGQ